jgi:FAD/FMN-containing dehydrogenase
MLVRRQFNIILGKLLVGLAGLFSTQLNAISLSSVSSKALAELRKSISGKVIDQNQEDYDSWRRNLSWQLRKTHRRPELMVQALTNSDVRAALHFANVHDLKVGIRTGGHSWVHSAVRDGGLLIDLRYFKDLQIDVKNKRAIAGPALTARELTAGLAQHSLAFPVAHCSTVPLGGYLLGGGQAWNNASWGGAACNSVVGIDVVNAEGELIYVDKDNYSDLFWAAKGAGPGFPGVVVGYHLHLYPLPEAIRMNTYIWPLSDTLGVSRWLAEVAEKLSDKVEILMYLSSLPEPVDGHTQVVIVSAVAFTDSNGEAETLLMPLKGAKTLARPLIVEELTPTTFEALLNLVDRSFFPCRAAADTFWFEQSMEEVMEQFVDHFASAPSPFTNVLCEVKPLTFKPGDSAYSMRRTTYLSPYAFWLDAKDDEVNLQWMKKTQEILAPMSQGHYINEADLEVNPDRSEKSFSEEAWQQIEQVQLKYDPNQRFHNFLGH